jgi:hypothetical protein
MAMNGRMLRYCSNGGYPLNTGMRPLSKRIPYASTKAHMASTASVST